MIRYRSRLAAGMLFLAVMLACCFTSCATATKDPVISINGETVSYDLYHYFYDNYEDERQSASLPCTPEILEDLTEKSIRSLYALLFLWEEAGHSRSDTVLKEYTDSYVSDTIDTYGGASAFRSAMAKNHMTEDVYRLLITADRIGGLLKDEYIQSNPAVIPADDETVRDILNGDTCIRAVQIMISNSAETDKEENLILAQNLCNRLAGGEDFDSLVSRYSNDYTMTPDGYYLVPGVLKENLESVVFGLDIGEVSEVVESDSAYHIFKRLEKDSDYIESHFETLKSQYITAKFNQIAEKKAESLSIRYLAQN